MGKSPTIDSFFKRKHVQTVEDNVEPSVVEKIDNHPKKTLRIESMEFDINNLERDPGLRMAISKYPVNKLDEVRRAYIKYGPYQCVLAEYPSTGSEKHSRRFQSSWFKIFPSWLEYSPKSDAAFCLPCYLFNKPGKHHSQNTFFVDGFRNWKKVRNGKDCAFLNHIGKDLNSLHKIAEKLCEDLMNHAQHVRKLIDKQTSEQIEKNRLRLKASVTSMRYLACQGLPFRGHDESKDSFNRGNFLEFLSAMAKLNENIANVVLDKAPQNASYTSPIVQKEILLVFSMKIRKAIREEIGDAKFCIIVDEARDQSKREQMGIVLRFVDIAGFVRERFFDLVHVSDTKVITLKNGIFSTLSRHDLDVQNIRGQGYDGASNMRGEFNGLQALVANECPYAYYVHCLAHRLQLALVGTSREVIPVHHFFTKINFIINIVGSSCKRIDELKAAQASDITYLISIDELETGRGKNQIGSLQRAGDTRWGSHLKSISSLLKMFSAACTVLLCIIDEGTNYDQRADADSAYTSLTSFEFVFILHLMKEIMEITDMLSQALQQKSQDILNAMHLVGTTKNLIQKLRDDGCDSLFVKVKSFCESRAIDIPDMKALYVERGGRARKKQNILTIEDHYRINVFIATIDNQLAELNNRFSEHAVKLLVLSSMFDPRNSRLSFNIDDACLLVSEFYPNDFTEYEKDLLRVQLQHYEVGILQHLEFQNLCTLSDLCQWMAKSRKALIYPLIDRLIRLILTLPVSTATTERAFSAMSIVKSELRNKMEDDFLTNSLTVFIEREIARNISTESIIDGFRDLKERRVQF